MTGQGVQSAGSPRGDRGATTYLQPCSLEIIPLAGQSCQQRREVASVLVHSSLRITARNQKPVRTGVMTLRGNYGASALASHTRCTAFVATALAAALSGAQFFCPSSGRRLLQPRSPSSRRFPALTDFEVRELQDGWDWDWGVATTAKERSRVS